MAADKNVTIKDVAKEANVSISVVSYVLNRSTKKTISEGTKQRVWEAAKRLGYVPSRIASGMRNRRSLSIGIVSYWEMDGNIFMHMLSGILTAAAQSNYSVAICNPESGNRRYSYLDYYFDGTIDGIIFISPYEALGSIDEKAHIDKMKSANVPFVMINGHSREPGVSYINIDFYRSTHMATQYLIARGFEDITYVAPLTVNYAELQQRYLGYKDAMAQHGLRGRTCDVGEISKRIKGFKAVVANKSDTAYEIIKEANRQSIAIPGDFALIAGNTESYTEYLFPPLSSVKIKAKEMGMLAAQTLLKQLSGRGEVIVAKSECVLQIRKSC